MNSQYLNIDKSSEKLQEIKEEYLLVSGKKLHISKPELLLFNKTIKDVNKDSWLYKISYPEVMRHMGICIPMDLK